MRAPKLVSRAGSRPWLLWGGLSCVIACAFIAPELGRADSRPSQLLFWSSSALTQQRQGFGRANQNNNQNKKATGKEDNSPLPTELQRKPDDLPAGYAPPPPPDDQLQIVDEWPIPEFKKDYSAYQSMLIKGVVSGSTDLDRLKRGIQWRLALMTLRSAREFTTEQIEKANEDGKKLDTLADFRADIEKDLNRTLAAPNQFSARDEYLKILCAEAPKLFKNHYFVRVQASYLLSGLLSREEDKQRGTREVPCLEAVPPLLALINDPTQHWETKLPALGALARTCRSPACPAVLRFDIIDGLRSEMANAKKLYFWYGIAVAKSLGELGSPDDRNRQPVVVTDLLKVLSDPDREYHIMVRAQAARALGRVPLESYGKVDQIALELVRFGSELCDLQGKSPNNWQINMSIFWLYQAFRAVTEDEKTQKLGLLAQCDSKPALASGRKVVEEAFAVLTPLFPAAVVGGQPTVPTAQLQRDLKGWIDARSPAKAAASVGPGGTGVAGM